MNFTNKNMMQYFSGFFFLGVRWGLGIWNYKHLRTTGINNLNSNLNELNSWIVGTREVEKETTQQQPC